MKPYKPIFLSIISGTLLVLSFPLPGMWFLAWIALIPFFIAIDPRRGTARRAPTIFLLGFLAGLVFFYSTINWLNSIAIMATIALVLYLALYFALFAGLAAVLFKKNMPVFLKCVLVSSVWVALEFARSNLLTGFGWALLGYSQAPFLPAIQIADITGVWGVSFIVVFVNVAIYEFFFVGARRAVPLRVASRLAYNRLVNLFFCLLLIAAVFIYGFYKMGTPFFGGDTSGDTPLRCVPFDIDKRVSLKISIIQGNIPQSLKWDEEYRGEIIKRYFDLTMQAAKDEPDIIIWPETAFPADLELEPVLARNLFNLAQAANTYLLIGANRYKDRNIYNSAFLIGPDGAIKGHYDKLHLVPFGEYIPRIPKILYKILPEKINMVGDFTAGGEYTVFDVGANGRSPLQFSTLICFEDVFPQLSRRFVKNGARLLVNITNDGWYGISAAPFQHAQASVFRAVENRVPVVRAANTGYSVFIDEKGRVINRIEPFTAGYKTEVCKIKS